MVCSIAGALEAIGDRWAFLVLRDLSLGLTRYEEFQRSTGMPPNTLAARLRHLEANGLIARHLYSAHPPRHEYRLTPKGRDLQPAIVAMLEWGDRWQASGADASPLELYDRNTGRRVKLAFIDTETGEAIPQDRLAPRPGPGADAMVVWRLTQKTRREAGVPDSPSEGSKR